MHPTSMAFAAVVVTAGMVPEEAAAPDPVVAAASGPEVPVYLAMPPPLVVEEVVHA